MWDEEKNKALTRWWWEEVWVKGNVAATDEFMAPNYVDHPNLSGLPPGPEGMKQALTYYHSASPELEATIDDIFAAGDRVALRWSARATHLGEWLDVPPTGHHFTMSGITIYRIAQGKAVEGWNSIEVNPTEEEQLWLTEGGGWPGRSGDIPATERDRSPPFWDVLTRNLSWRSRVAEAQERERIEQELQVARQIQQALLPEATPELDGWELTTYYEPAREVGGDFYDFLEFEDGRLGLVVGDATGKGMPAALVMATTRGMLRAVVQSVESPGEVLARVNEALVAEIPQNMFVTCLYAILDPKSGSLRYANAGHDLPYLRHHGGGDAEELRARGLPLGLMPNMPYEEKEAVLARGDNALFYSDGLVEAHNPQREMFGFARLRSLVAEHAEEGSLVDFLMEELYSFVGEGWEQEDDITLLTLERSAT
ncbi:MAG TPA: SpoIIE family protein phosphatase [Rubrobacter sp.]|nr:SpoIIE family protein phosphatase [Rubrobacter sp.]